MLLFDIEADGLLEEATRAHALVIRDLDKGVTFSCADQPQYPSIEYGLDILAKSEGIAGHNILGYDIPLLAKLYPSWSAPTTQVDTLVLSRLIYTNLLEEDSESLSHPPKLRGGHSLEAWGHRLNLAKIGHEDWSKWSLEMQKRCEGDIDLTEKLWRLFESKKYHPMAIKLEHEFAKIMIQQEKNGVPFNSEEAEELYIELFEERKQLRKSIKATVPSWIKREIFLPKRDNKTLGYTKNVPFTKEIEKPFNPGSRKQIYTFLHDKYNWTPDKKTENGNPSLDAEVMEEISMAFPEAKLFQKYLTLSLLMPKIKTGRQAWLRNVKPDGRIHGRVNSNGAVTGRCTHSGPNLSQVPSARKFKGRECRTLFHAPPGMVMVGCDASGLELRCLAHFLATYDSGAYTKIILEGDVHTANMNAAGIEDRDKAKTFIYAFLYGAGYAKLGSIIDPAMSKAGRMKLGKKLKSQFLAKTPGLEQLLQHVQAASRRGHLIGLDGRLLHVRSKHKALNTLLQSAGGLVMKKATCLMWEHFNEIKIPVVQALNIHDENQVFCYPDEADVVGGIMRDSIAKAGDFFDFRCPLDASYNIGDNWYETH